MVRMLIATPAAAFLTVKEEGSLTDCDAGPDALIKAAMY